MTLDAANIDLRRAFVPGMGYVALSRVRRLEDLTLTGLNNMALRVSPEALAIDVELRTASDLALERNTEILVGAQARWDAVDQAEATAKAAAHKAATKSPPAGSWAERLDAMRQTYPNAYRPWSEADDAKLKASFESGEGLKQLSAAFGRHPGSIRSRLRKHFGDEVSIHS